ncbi:MAG: hypothetical protein GY759_22470 [Chloroflexi bacterium]|nr:hypothetical protein [Chloroflexota bacterium]
MIREADLRELVEFDGRSHPVLSLYLNVDSRDRTVEKYKLALRRLFDNLSDFDALDRKRIEQYFDLEYDRQARGVVCFSCQSEGFWRAYPLHVSVEDAIISDRRPLLRRLVELIDTYGYLGVVAVDKQGARFFSFHLGVLEEATGTIGEDVKRHKQGGWAASRYQRHEDEAAMGNLRAVAELTEQYTRQYHWRRLVLAGTDSNVATFQEMLPTALQGLVVGSTPLELTASIQDVRERAESVALSAHHDHNRQLAASLIVTAEKGGAAVLGLAPTLDALQSGRVHQLLFSENYQIDNEQVRRCTECDYLSADNGSACAICGGATEPLPDAVNTLARRAITQDAQVVVLSADNPLAEHGYDIGAYLRY